MKVWRCPGLRLTVLSVRWGGLVEGGKEFENCPHTNCQLTFNKSKVDLTEFSALIFHSWALFKV